MLDPAKIPERKSFPPRLVIMFLGTFLAFAMSVVLVLASARWKEADAQDPRRVLLHEVAGAVRARIPWAHANGASPNGAAAASRGKDSVSQDNGGGPFSDGSLKP